MVPVEGATQSGEAVHGTSEEAQKPAADAAKNVPNGTAPAAAIAADQSEAQRLASDTRAEEARKSLDTNGTKDEAGLVAGVNNVSLSDKATGEPVSEPPNTTTRPGEPFGEGVTFDHEPSKKEAKEAMKQVGA